MSSGFVSEQQLSEERERRQEEWRKVRKADDPLGIVLDYVPISNLFKIRSYYLEVPDEQVCNKSLYEQLKEQKDKKQLELDEAKKFSEFFYYYSSYVQVYKYYFRV